MKKLLVILAAAALIAAPTVSLGKGPGKGGGGIKKLVWCCFPDGGCVQTSKENCEFKKAQVVTSCDQCAGANKKKND